MEKTGLSPPAYYFQEVNSQLVRVTLLQRPAFRHHRAEPLMQLLRLVNEQGNLSHQHPPSWGFMFKVLGRQGEKEGNASP